MTVLLYMLLAAVMLACAGLAAFVWALRSGQFDDPKGDAARILTDQEEPL
ncbi:MAG TPA: cbb3-type cytochrome oxidase assembly protein CcoS [Hyphomonadaceae bacterium]|nr:cbb3-type cytochrome oxidase assembly protein CcoS [Hyphomonadaceae bacterium]